MNIIQPEELLPNNVKETTFGGQSIQLLSAPPDSRIDISNFVRDIDDFHGPRDVDQIVVFGQALKGLIGTVPLPDRFENLADIQILSTSNPDARAISDGVKDLAIQLVANATLYDDEVFCKRYYDLAKQGYALFDTPAETMIPVSLIRAGLVTTRLAYGLGMHDIVPNEVQIETKRAHPKNGEHDDLMVTVRWPEGMDPYSLKDKDVLLADFVNPASWASTGALLMVLKHCFDALPRSIEHRSFMGTVQGVEMAERVCKNLGIVSSYRFVDIAHEMNSNYYLTGAKVVGDAGHALRHFRP